MGVVDSARRSEDLLVLAVDCSTTAAKAVLFDAAGRSVASGHRPLSMDRPNPGWHEQDATQWWEATRAAIRDAVDSAADSRQIAAVCMSHQRESFVCLDAAGQPLRPAILWLDSRAATEIAEFGSPEVAELSGKPPDVTPAIYKLAWLRRNEPQVLAEAARVGDVHAYLCHRLTGRWASAEGSADALGLLDIRRLSWAPELLAIAGVRAEQLPELYPAGQVIAELLPAVAAELGLPGPIPLIAGIGDGQAAGLGANVTEVGSAYLNLGTSMVVGVQSSNYQPDRAYRTLVGAIGGQYTLETVLNSAAYLADWFRRQFGDRDADGAPDPELDAAAAEVEPGAEGLLTLPYWNCAQSPYWDPQARGAIVGWTGRHQHRHMYRSILEAVGYELRLHLDGLQTATGEVITTLRAMGGGTRSALWTQLLADITGRTIEICDEAEMSARGAAVIARAGLLGGGADRIRSAAQAAALPGRQVCPDPAVTARYDGFFAIYRELYPQLRGVFAALGAARKPSIRPEPSR